jgi:mono/diheme cytochrome c family protein
MEAVARACLSARIRLSRQQTRIGGERDGQSSQAQDYYGRERNPNSVPATKENIADDQEHFGHHCGICHGLDGEATGVPFADKMSPPVPSLSSKDVQDYEDGQLKWIIENGINPSGMPAWKGILDDEEMWKVVNFIRHRPPKGSLGTPEVYKEEQEEHEHTQGHKHHD